MRDLHPLLRFGLFVVFYALSALLLGGFLPSLHLPFLLLAGLGNLLVAVASTSLMLLYEKQSFAFVGLSWGRDSMKQLGAGLFLGCFLVSVLTVGLVAFGQVRLELGGLHIARCGYLTLIFLMAATGEELLFRGYGFQRLIEAFGPAASIILLSILFAAMHRNNPGASVAGLVNTVIVGNLLALAYLRTRKLWLPIGIHWGWNLAEASWGFPVSGIRIEGMPLVAVSSGHPLITGGAYGPEASLVGTFVIVAGIAGLLLGGVEQNHAA